MALDRKAPRYKPGLYKKVRVLRPRLERTCVRPLSLKPYDWNRLSTSIGLRPPTFHINIILSRRTRGYGYVYGKGTKIPIFFQIPSDSIQSALSVVHIRSKNTLHSAWTRDTASLPTL